MSDCGQSSSPIVTASSMMRAAQSSVDEEAVVDGASLDVGLNGCGAWTQQLQLGRVQLHEAKSRVASERWGCKGSVGRDAKSGWVYRGGLVGALRANGCGIDEGWGGIAWHPGAGL